VDHRSSYRLVRGVENDSRNGTEMWVRYAKVDLHVALAVNSDSQVFLFELVQFRGVGSAVAGSSEYRRKLLVAALIDWSSKNVILTSADMPQTELATIISDYRRETKPATSIKERFRGNEVNTMTRRRLSCVFVDYAAGDHNRWLIILSKSAGDERKADQKWRKHVSSVSPSPRLLPGHNK
jgi:hypothetical protein